MSRTEDTRQTAPVARAAGEFAIQEVAGGPGQKQSRERRDRERGLPDDAALRQLAALWLETQRRLWPSLARNGSLPRPSEELLAKMAAAFRERFVTRTLVPFVNEGAPKPWIATGASYIRYSSVKSSKRSLDDQLLLQLQRAATDKVYLPWEGIFADAAITGTHAFRNGYAMVKEYMAMPGPAVLYLDELGRASRDMLETLQLARLIESLDKRMIGVSDSYDSKATGSKNTLLVLGMVNEMFVDQLRDKISRSREGMKLRGNIIYTPPLGIRLVPVKDARGEPIVSHHGKVKRAFAIDPAHVGTVNRLATMFVDERLSARRIAIEFNLVAEAGRRSWNAATVLSMLTCHLYVGISITNRFRWISGTGEKRKRVRTARSEWTVERFRHLQIWSWKRWKSIQERLREVRQAFPGRQRPTPAIASRNTVYPTTILSGVVFCGSCGRELLLWKSNCKKHYQFYCPNGRQAVKGCKFRSTKSVALLSEAILSFVRDKVFTEERVRQLVSAANRYLEEERTRPKTDPTGLIESLDDATARRDRLIALVADGMSGDLAVVREQILKLDAAVKDIKSAIGVATARLQDIAPLTEATVLSLLKDLPELLSQEPHLAAPALRALLGKVYAKQVDSGGAWRKQWLLTCSPNLLPSVSAAAHARGSPDSLTLGTLCKRNWTCPTSDSFLVNAELPPYVVHGPALVTRVRQGSTVKEAAGAIGISYSLALIAYHHLLEVVEGFPRADHRKRSSRVGVKSIAATPVGSRKSGAALPRSLRSD